MKKLKIWICDFETITSKTEWFKKYNDRGVYLGVYIYLYGVD